MDLAAALTALPALFRRVIAIYREHAAVLAALDEVSAYDAFVR
jgi:hypothetical protein